jgi:hypothetical protein
MSNRISSSLSDFMLKKRASSEHEIIKKIWADESLKEEFLKNPEAVLAREMGLDSFPSNINVQVLEEDESTLYFVIPKKPPEIDDSALEMQEDGELSDEALESVAGGSNYVATGYSDVASVWKTGLTSSFLYGVNELNSIREISQFKSLGRF